MRRLLLLGAATLGCSSPDPAERSASCAIGDRSGTYLMTFTTLSGDCGDIPQQLGRLDNAAALPDICAFDAPDRWTEGDCKLERAYTCLEQGIGPGVQSHNVAVTNQDTSDGSRISGTTTMRITDAGGQVLCSGTYSLSAVRQ